MRNSVLRQPIFVAILFAVLVPQTASAQVYFSADTVSAFTWLNNGSAAWGDYDNDGDLDIIIAGSHQSGTRHATIYRNDGDSLFVAAIGLTGISNGSVNWGDYDNDGYLDLAVIGATGSSTKTAKIYHNNSGVSFTEAFTLTETHFADAAWGDYNNDGYVDLIVVGSAGTQLYKNNDGAGFTQVFAGTFTNVTQGSVSWGDYNKDGFLDVLLNGSTGVNTGVTKIYENNDGAGFAEVVAATFLGVFGGQSEWGDYNVDGYPDVALTGLYGGGVYASRIYRNNADTTFTHVYSMTSTFYSSLSWSVPFNNGGAFHLTGTTGSYLTSALYLKSGADSFIEMSPTQFNYGFYNGATAWADYDRDGVQDVFILGNNSFSSTSYSELYHNDYSIDANTAPTTPTGLSHSLFITNNGGEATLSWTKSTDFETAQNGLTYNIRIGSTPGGVDVLSPMSDVSTGFRRVAAHGNVQYVNTWVAKGLPAGTYYWSVQAIDAQWDASGFATEQSFTIPLQPEPQTPSSNVTTTSSSSNTLDLAWTNGDGTFHLVVMKQGGGVDGVPQDTTTYAASAVFGSGTQIGTGNYVVYSGSGSSVQVTGLTHSTTYHVAVYEFHGGGGIENYLSTPATLSQATPLPALSESAGQALTFNGTDQYVSIPDRLSLRFTDSLTIEAWIYPTKVNNTIIDKGNYNYLFSVRPNGTNGLGLYNNGVWRYSGGTVPLNEWSHVAVVSVAGTNGLKFYLNGALLSEQTMVSLTSNTGEVNIGRQAPGSCNCNLFQGVIDEVRIWNVPRTTQQIRENVHRMLDGTESGLVAYWQFNEATGTVAVDSIAGNNGTLVNSPTWSSSPIPAGGRSTQSTQDFTTGTAALGSVSITTTDDFDTPVDLTATEIESAPNTTTGVAGAGYSDRYWVIDAFDTSGSFATTITFTYPPETFDTEATSDPSTLHLYRRNSSSVGTWTDIASASAATDSTVTFTGITSFSQFLIANVARPTIQASSLSVPAVARLSVSLQWVNGNGAFRVVLMKAGEAVNAVPTDSTTYTASATFGAGTQIGSGNYVVYAGSGSGVTVSGLTTGTTYHAAVYEYSGASGQQLYLTTTPALGSATTQLPVFDQIAGSTLVLDGLNDHVTTDLGDLSGSELTIEFWFKGSNAQSAVRQQSGGDYIATPWSTTPIHILSNDGGTGTGISAGSSINDGSWHHVAMTWKQNTANGYTSYLDGQIVAQRTSSNTAIPDIASTVFIGSYTGSGEYSNGRIDEVRIWNVARTADQIRQYRFRPIAASDAGLVSYWQFNEGTGTAAADSMGSHHGTLVNGASWASSTIPFGSGSVASHTGYTSGTTTLGNVTITPSDTFDNSVNLSVSRIPGAPNSTSGTSGNLPVEYWIIEAFGTSGTFVLDLTFSFGPGSVVASDQSTPSNVKLYRRDPTADGSWTEVASGVSATDSSVTFQGISSLGQFTVGSASSPLPVQMTGMSAEVVQKNSESRGQITEARLRWTTASEVDNVGWEVERRAIANFESTIVNFQKVGFVEGAGTSSSPREYVFTDDISQFPIRNPQSRFVYRLKQIDRSGSFSYSHEVEIEVGLAPREFTLSQNYPNPFNPATSIEFTLAEDGPMALRVYDVIGRLVATPFEGTALAGRINRVSVDAAQWPSGLYIYRLDAGKHRSVRKMMLMK